VIVRVLSLKINVKARASLLSISERPFHHQPKTLTTSPSSVKRLATKERDQALQFARGGSPFRRIARAAKWLLIGAAAGAIAVRSAH
jgi:hypothetical protein